MFFVAAILVQTVLLFLELQLRKIKKQKPETLQEFWALLSQRTTTNKKFTHLAFVMCTVLCFCFWEAALRVPLNLEVPLWSGIAGIFAGIFLLKRRSDLLKKDFAPWSKLDFLLIWLLWGMCWGPWLAIVCAPWYLLRVQRYLAPPT